jgi:predicted ATPase
MIRAQLFGELQVEVNGQPIARFRTRKVALLLAYLLRYPQRHPREHLLRLFWGDLPPEPARNNLRVALAMLRRVLEPPGIPMGTLLRADRRAIGLNPELVETDVAAFEDALQRGANASTPAEQRQWLEHACTLYTGDFLAAFDEPWVQAERERLRQLYQEACQHLQPSESALRQPPRDPTHFVVSHPPCGLGIVLGLERDAPLDRQRAWVRQVITACEGVVVEATATGVRAFFRSIESLLKAFDLLAQQLSDVRFALDVGEVRYQLGRYGGVPLDTVERLLQAGSAGQKLCTERVAILLPQARASVRWQLQHLGCYRLSERGHNEQVYQLDEVGQKRFFAPLQALPPLSRRLIRVPTPFIGREVELVQLQAWVQQPEGGILAIVGAPGVGKSRLALELAWRSAHLVGEARWWVRLHREDESVAEAVARTLGWEWRGQEPFLNSWRATLEGQPALLSIDTDHPLSTQQEAEIQSLVENIPHLRVVVAVQMPPEQVEATPFYLEPLPVPPEGLTEVDALLRYASVRLFVERARRVQPDFRLTPRNAAAVGTLCRQLEGLPLALELAAGRIGTLSLEAIIERLRHSVSWLDRRPKGTMGRSLVASLEASWRLLSEEAQHCLACWSVFRGGFTLPAAQAVAGVPEAADALAELVRASLVQSEEERYRLLEPVRLFVAEQLHARGQETQVYTAHLTYYLGLAKQYGDRAGDWAVMEAERANLEAALAWSMDHAPEQALEALLALLPFYERRGSGQSVYEMVCRLPSRLTEGASLLEAVQVAVRLAVRRGEMEQAGSMLARYLPLTDQFPDSLAAARLWVAAGFYYWMRGDGEQSLLFLQRALQRFSAEEAPLDRAEALVHLGVAHWVREELPAAACAFDEALELVPTEVAPVLRAKAMSNLSAVLYQMGRHAEAEACLQETLQLAQQLGDRRTEASLLNNWSVWLRERGEYARARELCLQANAIWQTLHEGIGEVAALNNLADIARCEGDHQTATTLFYKALERTIRYQLFWYLPRLLQNLAELAEAQGEWDDAIRWQSVRLFASLRYEQPHQVAPALHALVQLALKTGDLAAAARWLSWLERLEQAVPDTLRNAVQACVPAELLASHREQVQQASCEQLLEQLRPLASERLSPFEGTYPVFRNHSTVC